MKVKVAQASPSAGRTVWRARAGAETDRHPLNQGRSLAFVGSLTGKHSLTLVSLARHSLTRGSSRLEAAT